MPDAPPGQEDFSQQRRTFSLELLRAGPQGIVETATSTFALFVAIRVFALPAPMKAAIVASSSLGLLLSLFLVQLVRRRGWTVNTSAAGLWLASAAAFALAACSAARPGLYFPATCTALVTLMMATPLMAQIYRKHYPAKVRGRLFSGSAMLRAALGAGFGWLGGWWLGRPDTSFAPLFATFAAACIAMAGCVLAMAPIRLRASNRIRWFDAFQHAVDDRPFRKLLIAWMLLGLGNLLAMALFVEFAGNPRYGFELSAEQVGTLTSTIPMLAFIVAVVPWGEVFDRQPFYRVRALVNLFFLIGIVIYYSSNTFLGLAVGIAVHGVAKAGGNVLWTLWVTRFAEADKATEYMSVHTFLTGFRGILAPLFGFAAILHLGPHWVAAGSALLILAGTLVLLPEMRAECRRPARP